jgi:hypothetical protein
LANVLTNIALEGKRMAMPQKRKHKDGKLGVFALIEPEQKAALEALGRENQRSVGFLVREAIAQYLAGQKKKS